MSDPSHILNWRRVDARITLSGQPSTEEFSAVRGIGVEAVINLAPSDNKGALLDEAEVIARLGMDYTHIPVDFDNPTDEDFSAFCAAMERDAGKQLHIHCIYNARVTAFMLRFLRKNGQDDTAMLEMMDGIWRPGGVWARFLSDEQNVDQPNRYKGYEY